MGRIVRDIMEKDVRSVTPETSLVDLERRLLQARVGALPVVERTGELVGIASRSDVVRQLSVEQSLGEAMADAYRDQKDETWSETSTREVGSVVGQRIQRLRVSDVMIREVITISPDCNIQQAAGLFVEHHVHRLPVVAGGRLVGILSTLDLARLISEGESTQA
jgi:CBS domain-containing protein